MRKISLFLFTSVLMLSFYSCGKDDEEILLPSTNTKILGFKASSNECDTLGKTLFNRDALHSIIWNSDLLPEGTVIRNMKFDISTYFASKILIDDQEWNGVDSVMYDYPIKVTVFAQDGLHKQDYELKININ